MSTARFDTLQNAAGTKSVPVGTVVDGSAKAWVNFNGTGTVAIRASFNVTSITDNGVGDYTLNFTNAMVDANYALSGAVGYANTNNAAQVLRMYDGNGTGLSASTIRFKTVQVTDATTTAVDAEFVHAAIFR